MRRLTYLLTIVVIIAVPGLLHAAMESYCSAPPYVTRSIAPNIMILMDNSNDMYNPAYTGTYSTSTTYTGYFKPGACYKYSTNKFVEEQKTGSVPSTCTTANCYTSYTSSDTCPSTAPFRGNLLNWATMSKYDVLQKVIIGGNATSKQGNAHTLISASNDWGTNKAGAGADSDVYSNCEFLVSGGTVTVKDVTANSCTLLNATPAPIAFWQDPVKNLFAWLSSSFDTIYSSFFNGASGLFASLSHAWGKIELTAKAWASHTLAITPASGTTWTATVGQQFTVNLSCSGTGSACPNGTYGWTFTGLPAWMSVTKSTSGQRIDITATLSGTPTASGTHTITAVLSLTGHTNSPTYTYTLTVSAGALTITTVSLPAGGVSTAYSQTLQALGGVFPYTWSISSGSLPPGLSLNVSTGEISGTPLTAGYSLFTAMVTDSIGSTAIKALSITVAAAASLRSTTYNVKVELVEEDMTDLNGNNIWDTGETYIDFNGNGSWDGKQGVFQKFWDENNPRARWGFTKFGTGGTVEIDSCIPASPASSFYTRIQNAQPTDESPLARGLYGIINYFGFSSTYFSEYVANQYSGCSNSNPLDNTACRKNFVLVISSGSNVGPATGYNFTGTNSECTVDYSNSTVPLVKNACYGYKKDLRDTATADMTHPSKQNLYTYIVDTGSETTNDNILKDAAQAGHGKYYPASSTSDMEAQLTLALTDILAQAASGTAVSVLTTSSRGIGSMVQAYFLPTKLEETREVWWTGYTQNIWIDPKDNLREDTTNDYKLKLDSLNDSTADKVIKLYFDSAANETKVATFTTDANGENGTLASCLAPESAIKAFDDVNYLWEGGKKLALTRPNARKLFTSTKVLKTSGTASITTTTQDFSSSTGSCGSSNPLTDVNCFTVANIAGSTSDCSSLTGNTQTMCNALDRDTSGDADKAYAANASNIVRYVRGECLETGISGDTSPCGTTANGTYRDRRLTVSGGDSNGNVWKLGDIISSTPKVLANTPVNTYHIDYGDSTYYNYVTSNSYKQRSSIAFVGANDGVLHAFRVGYLKDTGLDAGVKALFKNFYSSADTENSRLGEEVWGYIPFNAFPYLRYLASTGYCHIYFNDLSVRLVDASIGGSSALPTDTRAQADWKTILIGGMRFGGGCAGGTPDKPATVTNVGYSAYYAIDITNPEDPVPLWEFSDDDMGYASTFPSVIRTGETNKNGYWYVVFGSGSKQMPKANTDIYRGTTSPLADPGYIYILNLKTGALEKKIALDHNAIVGDILAIDKEKDYHAEKVYFGTAYKDNTDGIWKGKLVNIAIPNQNLSDAWTPTITYHFSGNYPFTASPDAARDTDGNVWVFAGSGKYYSDVDDSDASAQIFLGMKDSYSGKTTTNMDDRTNTNTTGTVTGTALVCGYDSDTTSAQYGTFHLLTYVTSISAAATVTTPTVGWYLLFSGGERIITRPLAIGGLVDFLTYKPNASDPCSYGGSSYLYAVGYTTGVAPANVAIMSPDAVTSDGTVKKGILLGVGAPPTGEAIIIPPPKEGQETLKKKIQIATGVIVEAENQPVTSVISKVVHWLKK